MNRIEKIYKYLLRTYGPQGWWPLTSIKGSNPTKTGSLNGYHPGDYSYPKTKKQRFEICCGTILTQNTSWSNAERAVLKLKKNKLLDPATILMCDENKLKEMIRPAGYYNQKARYLKEFSKVFGKMKKPSREDLLKIKGIGKETADSMLLYAFKMPTFVVDAYTKRILSNLDMIQETERYDAVKTLIESNLPAELETYQEFHALIVEHAKRHYVKKGEYHLCPLLNI